MALAAFDINCRVFDGPLSLFKQPNELWKEKICAVGFKLHNKKPGMNALSTL